MSESGRPLGAYYSHHKCATMYVVGVLGRVCRECGWRFRSFDDADAFGGDLRARLERDPADLLAYLNAEWERVEPLGDLPAFHVVRDPRDLWVSAYFSHLHSHPTEAWPELEAHRARLRAAGKEEGLLLELAFIANVFEAMDGWEYGAPHVLELRFEELARDPFATFLRAFEHLGLLEGDPMGLRRQVGYAVRGLYNQLASATAGRLPRAPRPTVPAQRLLGLVYDDRFEVKSGGRPPGVEDRTSHYRRGEPGDWRRHLTGEHLERFEERYPGLLRRTGYP